MKLKKKKSREDSMRKYNVFLSLNKITRLLSGEPQLTPLTDKFFGMNMNS